MSANKGESWTKNKKYLAGRGKDGLHGIDYQLKLLMLFAVNGVKNCRRSEVKFSLATEKVDSNWDKFDDLIIRYDKGNGEIKYRFLQAKHKHSENNKIKIDDLKSDRDGNDFSLQTYFKSYLVYEQQYKDGNLKDFIICTNADFAFEIFQDKDGKKVQKRRNSEWEDFLEIQTKKDDILNIGGKIYKFKESKKEEIIEQLKPIFEEALSKTPQQKNDSFLGYLSKQAKVQLSSIDCINKIGGFLDKLVFAVDQPDGADLEEKIAENIGFEFTLINNIIYNQFYKFMFKWMQHFAMKKKEEDNNEGDKNKGNKNKGNKNKGNKKEAHFLTNDDLEIFFDVAKEEIISLSMVSSSLLYKAKIKNYGIEFNDEIKEFQDIKNFLNSDEKKILKIIYRSKPLLSEIKVCQILRKHYKSLRYIFCDLGTLSNLKSSVINPITAFMRLDEKLLIIEDDENMLNELIKVLKDHPKKKFILITTKGEKDEQLSIYKKTKCSELKDLSNKLTDLTDKCQNSLLNKAGTVIFQGKELTVRSIIEEKKKYLISGEVLRMLINNERIEIGGGIELHNYNKIKEYYIKRKFSRTTEDDENETSQDLIRSDDEPINATSESNLTIQSRDNTPFERIKTDEDDVDIVDWILGLPKNIENLIPSSITKKYRSFTRSINQSIPQDSINDKEVIIVSEPGMGKSMLLTHIALQKKETDPSLLVLKIKLEDYSSELNKLKTDNNNEAFVKFLYKTFLKKCTELTETFLNSLTITIEDHKICINDNESKIDDVSWLEVQLFNEFYNNGKVIFFFDGFDEICPDYKVEVIKLLKVLKRSRSKIWITTRPYNITEELEKELGVFSYCLERFSQDEQQNYLKKFWSVDDERSDIFVNGLREYFSKSTIDVKGNFLGIPLHLYMLAVVYKTEFKDWYESDTDIFSISDGNKERLYNLNYLYNKFIDFKFDDLNIKEKSPSLNSDKARDRRTVEEKKDSFLKKHKKLAAYSLLGIRYVKLFLSEQELNDISKMIEDIKVGNEDNGFISHVSDNKPVFVHRTFAEYFLSHFIFDKLKSGSDADNKVLEFLIKQILLGYKYTVVRRFLNCLFANYKADYNKSEIIKKLLKDIVYDITPLQVALLEGLLEIVKFLLENQPDELENIRDDITLDIPYVYTITVLQRSDAKYMEINFINLRYGICNALEWAVLAQHEDIVRLLLENGAYVTSMSVVYSFQCFSEPVFKLLLDYINSDHMKEWIVDALKHIYLSPSMFNYAASELIVKLDDVNIQNKDGNTPLHIVASFSIDNISDLLYKGIDIKYQGRETPLIISKLLHTCVQARSYLLNRGVELKIKTDGNAKFYWVRTVELLLEKGADENILNNKGERPVDLVPDFNEIKEYLNFVNKK